MINRYELISILLKEYGFDESLRSFIASRPDSFILVLAFSINTWLSYIVCSIIVIGLVVFPFRLGIIETIRDYKDYRKNRPVKILNSVNKSLSTDKK
jgi:hypothetical protein